MRVAWLKDLRLKDLPQVGGKNASLGEMIGGLAGAGIRVPGGFATTADAFREFLAQGGLDRKIEQRLEKLDPKDVRALAACGTEIRSWIAKTPFPAALEQEIKSKFQELEKEISSETSFAVRSSATAEDLPVKRNLVRGPVLRHGRGPARRLVRRATGDLPQHQGRRQRAGGHPPRVRLPL
jgi:pyruvate, water dikinase